MPVRLIDVLTAGGLQWHETLPFAVGFLFVAVEIVARTVRRQGRVFHIPALGYILSEGVSVTIMPIYGFGLAFNPTLASQVADRNSKVLAVAMFVAFGTLFIHVLRRWFSGEES
jgi:hypothetical protein